MIRARSYAIWEREGRLKDRDEEYWYRAEAEIEAECRSVLQGENPKMVLPLPRISRKPVRRQADAIEQPIHYEAA
jgi:hypothetical protein